MIVSVIFWNDEVFLLVLAVSVSLPCLDRDTGHFLEICPATTLLRYEVVLHLCRLARPRKTQRYHSRASIKSTCISLNLWDWYQRLARRPLLTVDRNRQQSAEANNHQPGIVGSLPTTKLYQSKERLVSHPNHCPLEHPVRNCISSCLQSALKGKKLGRVSQLMKVL